MYSKTADVPDADFTKKTNVCTATKVSSTVVPFLLGRS